MQKRLIAPYKGKKQDIQAQEPHLHTDGMYVASPSRFEVDYLRVKTIDELIALLDEGLSIRMSSKNPKTAPSLISPKSIQIIEDDHYIQSSTE